MTEPKYTKEAHDLLTALAKSFSGSQDLTKPIGRASRLYLAAAEKESAEPVIGATQDHPAIFRDGSRLTASPKPQERFTPCNHDCDCSKPSDCGSKPQERSAEEILEGLVGDLLNDPISRYEMMRARNDYHTAASAALAQVRVLRAERDELAASVGRYQQLCRTLETQLVSLKP